MRKGSPAMTNEQINHKPGCDALGGYGHGVGPCTCKDAAGASEGQAEPVGYASKCEFDENGKLYDAATVNFKPEDGDVPLYTHPSAEIAALRERIAGMEKDAQRYRKVRMNAYVFGISHPTPEQLDALVDSDIAKEKQG